MSKDVAYSRRFKTVGISNKAARKGAYSYADVPKEDGIVVDLTWRPFPCDMCALYVEGRPNPIPGWWTGFDWYGLKIRKEHKIIAWKRVYELN